MKCRYLPIILSPFLAACHEDPELTFNILYEEDTQINFVNQLNPNDSLNILDYLYFYNGGGVAIGDINNDGLPDIFFSGNMVDNQLYLNLGHLKFKDITDESGVTGTSDWNTGVTMADVNADGFLDIYVCAVSGIHGLQGHNELFVNNGNGTFTERSAEFGLDFKNYSTSSSFFDYDKDGDLDMYLLNHSIHNVNSFGKASIRHNRVPESGDKLLRNDNGKFIDVSEVAGIYGGANGYGLGLAVADFDQNMFPDIYVSNDFHEDDYYYLNNGDGTFTESVKEYFGHTSKFSMGSDAVDINHDGYTDLITLDMLPDDEIVLKSSAGEDTYSNLKLRTEVLGYHHQYPRNMLHINRHGKSFSESGLRANIAATDWSWGALFADYDLDGEQDLFVSNGIAKRPNDLDYIKFISNEEIKRRLHHSHLVDEEALEQMPSGNIQNKIFRGTRSISFEDKSREWVADDVFISNGAAWGDLDRDGDIDIVTNNLDYPATIYENLTNQKTKKCFLTIKLSTKSNNTYGLGSKVYAYQEGHLQYKELMPSRGFQSSSEPIIHFGFNTCKTLDSLIVIWPDNGISGFFDLEINRTLEIVEQAKDQKNPQPQSTSFKKLFQKTEELAIDYQHKENDYVDFNRQKLIPYKISDRGPATAVGDFNGDGKDDIFFGGAKHRSGQLFIQTEDGFIDETPKSFKKDAISEDESAMALDLNEDGIDDLIVASGGGEFFGKHQALLDRVYLNSDSGSSEGQWPELYTNTSVIRPNDYDRDGDIDLFVGVSAVSNDFGKAPTSFLIENNGGTFSIRDEPVLMDIGMVTDAIWTDFSGDSIDDLIVVGEWMAPVLLENEKGSLIRSSSHLLKEDYRGLWRAITPFDMDEDGDLDFLLANWGSNSKFRASMDFPLKMYYGDFDENNTTETILAMEKKGYYYPIKGLDDLASQLEPLLKKKFTRYSDFAGRTIFEVFDKELIARGMEFQVNTLASGYLKNENGVYEFIPFPGDLQLAPINCFLRYDFDGDGVDEVLCAGNYFGADPYHGRLDGLSPILIKNEEDLISGPQVGLNLAYESVRRLNILRFRNRPYLVITVNNAAPQYYELTQVKR